MKLKISIPVFNKKTKNNIKKTFTKNEKEISEGRVIYKNFNDLLNGMTNTPFSMAGVAMISLLGGIMIIIFFNLYESLNTTAVSSSYMNLMGWVPLLIISGLTVGIVGIITKLVSDCV